jgi:hypothetical protein
MRANAGLASLVTPFRCFAGSLVLVTWIDGVSAFRLE